MKMKSLLKFTVVCIALVVTTPVSAGEYVDAHIVSSQPVYTSFMERNPTRLCNNSQVPIYGHIGGSNGANVLQGMIIGGLLGKGATGNDRGAAAGAVIGGVIAGDRGNRNRPITGYQNVQNCHTQYVYNTVEKISHYIVTADVNGQTITLTTNTLPMGNTIRVYVNTTYSTN